MKVSKLKKPVQADKLRDRRALAGLRIRSGVRAGYTPEVVYGPAAAGLWGGR